MAVVTFVNQESKETGQTVSIVGLATYMAIEHNYKILVLSTSLNDDTIKHCYFRNEELKRAKRNAGMFGTTSSIAMQNGIEGLEKVIRSNRITPDIITNYTKVIFKGRLEIMLGYEGSKEIYDNIKESYPAVVDLANQYYDLVFVDIDRNLDENIKNAIIANSNMVVATLSQKLASINKFIEKKANDKLLSSLKTLILIGRYDRSSKYNAKNISRYMKERNTVNTMPFNTLFFEACEEGGVPDLFLNFRKIKDPNDRNGFFVNEVKRFAENITYRLQDLQMKMG